MGLEDGVGTDTGRVRQGRGKKKRTIWCAVCQAMLDFCDEEDVYYYGTGKRPTPVHCMGMSAAYTAPQWRGRMHHGHRRHPPCPHCGADLGCDKCAGRWADTICTKCVSWASVDGFLEHGPFLNTPVIIARRGGSRARELADYPSHWQTRYRRVLAEQPDVPASAVQAIRGRFEAEA